MPTDRRPSPTNLAPAPVGHMILPTPEVRCLCGHGFLRHVGDDMADDTDNCKVGTCGCPGFEDPDPDNDYYPGLDDEDAP